MQPQLTCTPGSGSLLELAEAAGMPLPSGCRVGHFESCAGRVLSGTVRHLHSGEPDDEGGEPGMQADVGAHARHGGQGAGAREVSDISV